MRIVDFPRPQKGSNSQHRLVTLLGEFWADTDAWLPSHIVQELAGGIGMSRSATATAMSRLASRGLLEQSTAGRRSFYRFTTEAHLGLRSGFQRFASFSSAHDEWDGYWTVIAFTVPETDRPAREGFKARLKWHGFAPLYGALWASPRANIAELERICKSYGIDDYMVFSAEEATRAGTNPVQAWSLDAPRKRYEDFIDKYSPDLTAARKGSLEPAKAFAKRIELVDTWRTFPWEDPDLPLVLLPPYWPLPAARKVFVELYTRYGIGTEKHLRTVLAAHDTELAGHIALRQMPDAETYVSM